MKKFNRVLALLMCIVSIGFLIKGKYFTSNGNDQIMFKNEDSIRYMSMVDKQNFYIYKDNKWKREFIKGVNIGAAKPGYFPGEFGITKKDYIRWFNYISEMNSNTIRVYTILKPDFYNALYEFNKNNDNPLYLIQGVWINEEDVAKYKDAYSPKIEENFKKDIKTTIDIIHGKGSVEKIPGYAYGVYDRDLSPYVLGYILGIEWDPEFVTTTNSNNKDKINYEGKYLYTENASPFESFLCEIGDSCIEYETEKYKMQRPVSFVNWVTTDMLSHPNEPLPNEDVVSVNMEHIKKKDKFEAGLFASYHIYPYYPDSMNYQNDYRNFKDKNGIVDTYKAYLIDLKKEHTMPILVAEFGIPSSRGKAHQNIYMGFNQGNVSETDQGQMDAYMLKDIYEGGYAGGLIFAFQDEWFKRTWNTMDLDLSDRRPYWNNPQTNEQHFGLLAFDSGEKQSTCYIDGNSDDWKRSEPIFKNNNGELYIKSDETYLYFMFKDSKFDFNKDKLIIPIDTIQNQGNTEYNGAMINKAADFLISINGKDNSHLLVDPYYDSFQYLYGEKLNIIPINQEYNIKNSGKFVPMYLCLNKELYLPQDKVKIPFSKYETGQLIFGDGNPQNIDYNSLADFYVKDNIFEIRIPWQLLNVMDPSTKMIMDDLHINGINSINTDGISAGVGVLKEGTSIPLIEMNYYSWNMWETPTYHERLKQSYYIIKDAFIQCTY